MVRSHASHKGSPFYEARIKANATNSRKYMKVSDSETTGRDIALTQKSWDSLKLSPIPFYVKPPMPINYQAQELGYQLEGI